jgi:phage shock protein PspC (stress-responsive transcriptional regulator)
MNEQSTSEHSTTDPQTGLDKVFATLRGIPIRRRTDDKWIGGVCSGLADRFGVDPVIVRAGFVLLFLLGGVGITVYLVAWVLLPNDRDQIAAERALVHGEGGSILLLVIAAFAVFGGSWWSSDVGYTGWGFPWLVALTGLLIWWLVQRSGSRPDADQRVMAQRLSTSSSAAPSPSTSPAGPSPSTSPAGSSPSTFVAGPSPAPTAPVATAPVAPKRLRRRSGGPLMALLAVGLALVTYGSLIWMGTEYSWTGSHQAIAMAGALAAMGLLLVGLGLAGWRAGFVGFLTVVLAITAWSSAIVPNGIHLGGRVGDATWAPTSVVPGADYNLGVGNGVLDLSGLPTEGLSEAKLPAYVGLGELEVIVPEGLTVKVVAHVGLGGILLPTDAGSNGQGGSDLSRSVVIGDGPTEVVVDAGVGIGQLNVVKE